VISALGLDLGASGLRAFSEASNQATAEISLGPAAKTREHDTIELIKQLGGQLSTGAFDSVCLGMSGFASLQVDAETVARAINLVFGAKTVTVTSDMVTGHYSHFAEHAGVALVVGTGALAFGVSEDSQKRIDGLGASLGDFGSAAWIGTESMRRAKRAAELNQDTQLLVELEKALGESGLWPRLLASGEITTFAIAATSKIVSKLALEGEQIAMAIMDQAGLHAAESAIACANELNLKDVAFGGGVLKGPDSIATISCLQALTSAGLSAARMENEPGLGALGIANNSESGRLEFLVRNKLALTMKF
jgi:N-acetylglucosamine kinase-like BadF-type ATPase